MKLIGKKIIPFLAVAAALVLLLSPAAQAVGEKGITSQFSDVASGAWYEEGIYFCLNQGLMNGVSAERFEPSGVTSRAQIVTILYRVASAAGITGETSGSGSVFRDAAEIPDWAADAVAWCSANKLVNGYDNGCFGPNDAITREQFVTVLHGYAEKFCNLQTDTEEESLQEYPDASAVSAYAKNAMNWALSNGILRGVDGKLLPGGTADRAQTACILQRFCALTEPVTDDPVPSAEPVTEPENGENGVQALLWPLPGFNDLSAPFYEPRTGHLHGGIDISGPGVYGAAIVASADGVIDSFWYSSGGWGDGFGIYCMINHADDSGKSTLYAHMSSILVSPGESVVRGQVIGYVGETGNASGPHLHFETRLNGERYDPMSEFPMH